MGMVLYYIHEEYAMIKRYILITIGAFSIICIAYFACSISEGELGEFTNGDGTTVSVLPVPGAVLWLRADRGINMDTSNKICSWEDQSGFGNNAISVFKPLFIESDNNLNNKPVINFSNVESIETPEFLCFSNITIFIIYRASITGSQQIIFFDYGDHLNSNLSIRINTTDNENFYIRDSGGNFFNDGSGSITGSGDITVYHILTARLNFDTAQLYYNGSLDSSATNGIYNTSTMWNDKPPGEEWLPMIGDDPNESANQYLTGDIAEIIIYPSALSDPERVTIECYLSNKYGIPISGCEL